MSSDLKRQHERARCDILVRRLNITASFVRPGKDQDEPDMISTIAPARQRRRTEARDEAEGALLENEMEFASNA